MEWFVRWFIRSALGWFGVGVVLGICMAFEPLTIRYRPAHVHANLLGFVAMMIFGVAYHVIPRFNGRPLHRRRWAEIHFWAANSGLLLLVSGWILRMHVSALGNWLVRGGSALSAVGAFLFIANLWITLEPRRLETDERPGVSLPVRS